MTIAASNKQFLAFTGKLLDKPTQAPAPIESSVVKFPAPQARWVRVEGRTKAMVARTDTHLWCENCGTKYEITEQRCWQCDQPNCFLGDE